MSRPRTTLGSIWLSLAAPLLTLLGLVALLQRQGSDRPQALPAIVVGLALVISAVIGRRRQRHRLLMALRRSSADRSDSDQSR